MPIPAVQRLRFCLALQGALSSPWHSNASAPGLEPKFIEHNLEPLSEGPSEYALLQPRDVWSRLDGFSNCCAHRLVSLALCAAESRTHCCSILETIISCLLLADESSIHRFASSNKMTS